jgi:hypothetical protein
MVAFSGVGAIFSSEGRGREFESRRVRHFRMRYRRQTPPVSGAVRQLSLDRM